MKHSLHSLGAAFAAIVLFALVNAASAQATEYLVRADGAVTLLSGSVDVNYNAPGGGGSIHVSVQAGYSFDPVTGQVVPTTAAFLQNIIADVNTIKNNTQGFKVGDGANVRIRPTNP